MLEGVPFERELFALRSKYATAKLGNLFRSEKVENDRHQYFAAPSAQTQNFNGFLSSTPSAPSPESQTSLPLRLFSGNIQPAKSQTSSTWATTAGKVWNEPFTTNSPPSESKASVAAIPRNRAGQRIDSVIKPGYDDLVRIREVKMCVNHYLRGDCGWFPCKHGHDHKPSKNELEALRYLSRTTQCNYGPGCDDPKCIYGHHCPNEVSGRCQNPNSCRFPPEMHGIDRTPVRTLKVTGK